MGEFAEFYRERKQANQAGSASAQKGEFAEFYRERERANQAGSGLASTGGSSAKYSGNRISARDTGRDSRPKLSRDAEIERNAGLIKAAMGISDMESRRQELLGFSSIRELTEEEQAEMKKILSYQAGEGNQTPMGQFSYSELAGRRQELREGFENAEKRRQELLAISNTRDLTEEEREEMKELLSSQEKTDFQDNRITGQMSEAMMREGATSALGIDDETAALLDRLNDAEGTIEAYSGDIYAGDLNTVALNEQQKAADQRGEALSALRDMGYSDDEISRLKKYRKIDTDKKAAEAMREEQAEIVKNSSMPVRALYSIATIPEKAVGGVMGAMETVKQSLDGDMEVYNPYAGGYLLNRAANDYREESTKQRGSAFSDRVYSTLLSTGDSLLAAYAGGRLGGSIIGSQAMTDAVIDGAERGLDKAHTAMNGIAAAAFETIFESISIGNFRALQEVSPDSLKTVLKNIVKSSVVNGSEESATEIANILYDTLANGGLSQYSQMREQGYSKTQAALALAKQVGEAALGGMMQGVLMGGAGSAMGYFNNRDTGKALRKGNTAEETNEMNRALIESGMESEEGTRSRELARKLNDRQKRGEKITDAQMGALLWENEAAIRQEEKREQKKTNPSPVTDFGRNSILTNGKREKTARRIQEDREQLDRYAEALGGAGSIALKGHYSDELSLPDYFEGFMEYYRAGRLGGKAKSFNASPVLNAPSAAAAFLAGKSDRKQAQKRAEEQRTSPYSYSIEQAGLIENDHSSPLTQKEKSLLGQMGKSLGVRVYIDPPTGETGYNGYYKNGEIHIAADAEKKASIIAYHEATHRMQELAPKQYLAFLEAAGRLKAEELGKTFDSYLSGIMEANRKAGKELSYEEALDEAAANMAMEMDEERINRFVTENRSLAGRFIEALKEAYRSIKAFLTGQERNDMEHMIYLWEKAYRASEKSAKKGKFQGREGEIRYLIKYDQENRPFVVIDEDILKKVPKKQWAKTVKDNLRKKYPNGIEVGNQLIDINEQSRKEMTYSKYTRYIRKNEPELYADKLRATNNSDEIIKASRNYVNEELNHPREDDIIDFARGNIIIKIGNNSYKAEVVVGNRGEKGLILHDIVNLVPTYINEKTKEANTDKAANIQNESRNRRSVFASDNSILPEDKKINPSEKFSLKTVSQLEAELKRKQETIDRLKGEMKRSKNPQAKKSDVQRIANRLLTEYQSRYDKADFNRELTSLYESIMKNSRGRDEDAAFDRVYGEAREIARKVTEDAVSRYDFGEENGYGGLYDSLKGTRLYVSEKIKNDIQDYSEFKKQNQKYFALTSQKEDTPVDVKYRELSEEYPGLFPEGIENPSDQLAQMAEVMDTLRPVTINPYSHNMSEATDHLANAILDSFWEVGEHKTYADRQKLEKDRIWSGQKYQEKLDALREEYERKYRRKQEDLIEQGRRWLERFDREKNSAVKRRRQIEEHVKSLSQKLLKPTAKQHIPEGLKLPVAKFLSCVNLSGYELEYKDGKYRWVKPKTGAEGSRIGNRTLVFLQLKQAYDEILKSPEADTMVISPDLKDDLDALSKMEDTPLMNMGKKELDLIWKVLREVEASILSIDKMFGTQRWEAVSDAAEELRQYISGRDIKQNKNDRFDFLDRYALGMLTPQAFFHRMGEGGDGMFLMMRESQDRYINILNEAAQYAAATLEGTDLNSLEKEIHTFSFDGEEVKLTTAQIMSLRELLKRQQAVDHIMVGGFRPDRIRGKGIHDESRVQPYRLTLEQIWEILDVLTPEQKALADRLQKYMAGRLSEHGNKASMEVYNYRAFTEKGYFPIKTDHNQVMSDPSQNRGKESIGGKGFTKSTIPHANNSVIVSSIFDTFSDHVNEMATYAAWLSTDENLKRIYNYTFRDENGERKDTVKALMEQVYGKYGSSYYEKLISDVRQGVRETGKGLFSADRMTGNYKAARIGMNIRVIVQQPTAGIRAASVMNARYLLKAFRFGWTKDSIESTWETVKQYAPIARWKDWGYFEIGTGRQLKSILFDSDTKLEKAKNASMSLAGWMDTFTWVKLWKACELELDDSKRFSSKNDEYYRAVAERFNEVIDKTQVVDGVLQRSDMMRSQNGVVKMATSFMGEPTKVYNSLVSAVYDWKNAKGERKAIYGKRIFKTVMALLASVIANSFVQSVVDAIRDDDLEEDYWEKLVEAMTGDFEKDGWKAMLNGNLWQGVNPFEYLPYVKDLLSLSQGYDLSRMDMEGISRVLSAGKKAVSALDAEKTAALPGAVFDLAAEGADLVTGISAYNLKRDVMAVLWNSAAAMKNYDMLYYILKFSEKDITQSESGKKLNASYVEILKMAWENGDTDAYYHLIQKMLGSPYGNLAADYLKAEAQGEEEKEKAYEALTDAAGKEEADSLIKLAQNMRDKTITALKKTEKYQQAAEEYKEAAENRLASLSGYEKLDETAMDKALSMLQEYAGRKVLYDMADKPVLLSSDQKILKAEEAGVSDAKYILYRAALEMADRQNKNETKRNGSYDKEEKEIARKIAGLSERQQKAIE